MNNKRFLPLSNHGLLLMLNFLSVICLLIGVIFFASSFKTGEVQFMLSVISISVSVALFAAARALSLCEKVYTELKDKSK